ncbi:hypothetical protein [Streptomyces antimycoticus]|uniref:hypothetical protein n=1 Tax=Streptomyces antimycoticus TaxID=68175 RepID=UPI0036E112F7
MSTSQTEATAPAAGEAPASERPPRDVDDFLAELDTVLAESNAPTIPAQTAEPLPASEAAATVPEAESDLGLVKPPAAAPEPTADPVPAARVKDWWTDVYQDDRADQDTFTGNAPPPASTIPPKPTHAPDVAADQDADDDQDDGADDDQADEDDDQADEDEAPAKTRFPKKGGRKKATEAAGGAAVAAGNGLINNPKGRRVIFAGTAYGMGWSLGLDDWVTGLMTHAEQYALPVAGCALYAGVIGLATRSRFGAFVFVSSLALIAAQAMVEPARIVGGGLVLGFHIAYRLVRHWVGHHGAKWPWKGVLWAAHVPAATATVAFLLYGTN